jgi:hypothetical protein
MSPAPDWRRHRGPMVKNFFASSFQERKIFFSEKEVKDLLL